MAAVVCRCTATPWNLRRIVAGGLLSLPPRFPHQSHINAFPLRLSSVAQICQLTQAVRIADVPIKAALDEVKQIIDMANRASSRKIVLHTDFLTPPLLNESITLLDKLADVKAIPQGGYPQAERCRISLGHAENVMNESDAVAALSITGSFSFESYSHGDFLGAILGTGIAREKLGDIILQGAKGAQVLMVPELVDFVTSALDRIGSVRVSCTRIPLDALEYEPPRTQSFKTVEASVRVDAIASAGFKISRTKLAALISKGDVRVNWATVTKNGFTLKTGDVVSVSGQGRLKIGEIITTRKGKFSIELLRYL